jgi:hypothetical protein
MPVAPVNIPENRATLASRQALTEPHIPEPIRLKTEVIHSPVLWVPDVYSMEELRFVGSRGNLLRRACVEKDGPMADPALS